MAIDIGAGATDRAYNSSPETGEVDLTNPANDTGTLTVFEFWMQANATGVKCGTFYGPQNACVYRDHEAIGDVTAGSKQTFTGKNCDVTSGDFIGIYLATGSCEQDITGGSGFYYGAVDPFAAGTYDFQNFATNQRLSMYATSTPPPGPTIPVVMDNYRRFRL